WAVWCKPCLAELPYVDALYEAYRGDKDVSVLAVHVDMVPSTQEKPEKVAAVVHQLGLSLPVLCDTTFSVKRLVPGARLTRPRLVFFDPSGKLMRKFGFKASMPKDDWLAGERATVELARAGTLPPEQPPPPPQKGTKTTIGLSRTYPEGEMKQVLPQ